MANKFIMLGLVALVLSGVSLGVETMFLGGSVSTSALASDSFLMPLSFISFLIAGAFLIIGSMIKVAKISD